MQEQDLKDYDLFKDIIQQEAAALGLSYSVNSDEKSDAEQKFIFSVAKSETPDDFIIRNISCDIRTLRDKFFTVRVHYGAGTVAFNIDLSEVTNRDFSKRLLMIEVATQVISKILHS